jgi:hypothetical protein
VRRVDLFLVSFVMLLLELALIRWLSTEVRVFAYVNNLVLLCCFIGIGIGCYYAERRISLGWTFGSLAALLALVSAPLHVTLDGSKLHLFKDIPTFLSAFTDTVIWFQATPGQSIWRVVVGLLCSILLLGLALAAFLPLGQRLGTLLSSAPDRIAAYSLNVAASLAGIWFLNGLSFLYQPPWVWFAIVAALLGVLVQRERGWSRSTAGLCAAAVLGIVFATVASRSSGGSTLWSPYQKLTVHELDPPEMNRGYVVNVNDVGYMALLNLSDVYLREWPKVYPPEETRYSHYNVPYLFQSAPDSVLIVGAGGGNDAAGALRNGAGRVTAVEIDPGIVRIGKKLHPEHPYQDPRVEVVTDDARSFFKRARGKYDLISFGLLDSHTLSSSYNNMRIDHYVYTEESFREARALLAPGGVMTVIFEAQRTWVGTRLARVLREAFGHDPLAFLVRSPGQRLGWGGLMFVISDDMRGVASVLERDPALKEFVGKSRFAWSRDIKPTTDDWPYLYLETPRIPTLHLLLSAVVVVFLIVLRRTLLPRGTGLDWHFLFLGAAFLLLEFQNISRTTLLFGSTWLVNSFTISAILILILLANVVVSRWSGGSAAPGRTGARVADRKRFLWIYGGLLVSVAVVYVIPAAAFNELAPAVRVPVASLTLNVPIFFAGILFASSLRASASPEVAFGSNLIGAAAGGLLESLSFITGVQALVVLVGVFYAASLIAWWRSRGS